MQDYAFEPWRRKYDRRVNVNTRAEVVIERDRMVSVLLKLRSCIHQNGDGINEIAAEYGLDLLISDALIDLARQLKESASVIFLTTLAVHNKAEIVRPQMLLEAYQSIKKENLSNGISGLPNKNVLRQTIKSLVESKVITKSATASERRIGTGQEWVMAFELCLDHSALIIACQLFKEKFRQEKSPDFVLLCAKALVERAIGLEKESLTNWKEWVEVQSVVYHALIKLKIYTVAEKLCQIIGEYCSYFGDYQYAIRWYEKIPKKSDASITANFQIATCCGNMGNLEKSITYFDDFLMRFVDQSNDWININFNNSDVTGKNDNKADFNTKSAAQALIDLRNVLSKCNITPFLVSGTLLGYARDGAFLKHDKDIDVGILDNQDIFKVAEALNASGLFRVKINYMRIDKTYQLPVIHKKTTTVIDVFVFHQINEKYITGVQGNYGYIQNFAFSPFKLKTVNFMGIKFSVPENFEFHLEENFGNWRVSDPSYISHLQCPVTVDVGGLVYLLVARLELLKAIIEGKRVKIARVISILRDFHDKSHSVSQELINHIEARFSDVI